MAGGNEAQRSDRMELPKHSDDEGERRVFRQVKRSLRFIPACHVWSYGIAGKTSAFLQKNICYRSNIRIFVLLF
ncbi:MAG: hypothetical protein LBC02_04225 [Planctomycetaceae bacterium]|nr:hypothetical protein [Planctomycetaceae bacterium]